MRYHSTVTWFSTGVSAAVVELAAGSAQLVGVSTVPVHGINRTAHPDILRWFAACDKALTEAEDMTGESCGRKVVPNHVTMCVPGEITQVLPVHVQIQRRQPDAPLSGSEVEQAIERGYRRAQDLLGDGLGEERQDIIFGGVSGTRMDGQAVVEPLGMRGDVFELDLCFWVAPLEWLKALEVIARRLELHLVGLAPDHAAHASPILEHDALLVILDHGTTTIGRVRLGKLSWVAMALLGEKDIEAEAVSSLRIQHRNAELMLRAFREGRLKADVEEAFLQGFWRALRIWMTQAARQVLSVADGRPLPHRIYFLDATRRLPEAQLSLETTFCENLLPFVACPETVSIDQTTIRGVLDCTGQAGGPHYVGVRAVAHLVAQLYRKDRFLERALAEHVWRQLPMR